VSVDTTNNETDKVRDMIYPSQSSANLEENKSGSSGSYAQILLENKQGNSQKYIKPAKGSLQDGPGKSKFQKSELEVNNNPSNSFTSLVKPNNN
jgi:hypothetical protein